MVEPDQTDETPDQRQKSDVLKTLAATPHETTAWSDLFLLYWPRVIGTLYLRMGGNHDQAEDLAQDVFLRLAKYTDFRQFKKLADFERYLMAMCRTLVADNFRRSARMVSLNEIQNYEELLTTQPPPYDQVKDLISEINPLYEKLDAEERELFDLLTRELHRNEIATRMNITVPNAGVRIHRLRTKLKQLLTKQRNTSASDSSNQGDLKKD